MSTRLVGRASGALAAVALLLSLAACTKSSSQPMGTTTPESSQSSTPSTQQTGPVSVGALTEKTAHSCPLIGYETARSDAGFRLQTSVGIVSQNGKFAGCRFYPDPFPGERLPPKSQVAIEILLSKYSNATNAHNAFVRIASAGKNFQQDEIAAGNTGLCYQTTLWKPDNGRDWACTFSKGTTLVVIRTVVTDPALNVVEIAKIVYTKI